MRRDVAFLIVTDLIFIALLSLSFSFSGALYYTFYIISFLLPTAVAVLYIMGKRRAVGDASLKLRRGKLLDTVALAPPTLLIIVGISYLTSLLLSLFGKENAVDVSGFLPWELIRHALLPAVLEEILFRYIPIRILSPHSKRAAILVSALLFALIHLNLFQIPYALFAGVMLAFMLIESGNILVTMGFHFVNNTVSVLCMRDGGGTAETITLVILALLTVLSSVYIAPRRREYTRDVKEALLGKRTEGVTELIVMTVVCITLAAFNLR